MRRSENRIVLAVTSAQSLRLMAGFPDYLTEQGWDVHVVSAEPPSTPVVVTTSVLSSSRSTPTKTTVTRPTRLPATP